MINYSFKIFICAGCSSDNHQTFSQKLEGIVVVFQLLLKSNPPIADSYYIILLSLNLSSCHKTSASST